MQKSTKTPRFSILHCALLAAAVAVLAFVPPAFAQVKYVDERGVTHFVGSAVQVPMQYRDKAGDR